MYRKISIFLEMIKFEHTIFALPFAYLGAFLAVGQVRSGVFLWGRWLPSGSQLLWITIAMVAARTAAMSLNRLIDRRIDARNPRTANRALPRGDLSVPGVVAVTALSFVVLLLAAFNLNPLGVKYPLTVKFFPIVVLVLTYYSYTKRFTWTCHFILGVALGLAPVCSWLAVTGAFSLPAIVIGLAVTFWVAGFDIIYACQDFDFDRAHGVHSIPARFGVTKALWISALAHLAAPALLVAVGLILNLGVIYFIGVAVAIGLLVYEHRLVSPQDLSKLNAAFFNMNGYLSTMMFIFTLVDILLK